MQVPPIPEAWQGNSPGFRTVSDGLVSTPLRHSPIRSMPEKILFHPWENNIPPLGKYFSTAAKQNAIPIGFCCRRLSDGSLGPDSPYFPRQKEKTEQREKKTKKKDSISGNIRIFALAEHKLEHNLISIVPNGRKKGQPAARAKLTLRPREI